ncbi:MAG: hypothetical protein M0R80_08710 [Proteobacteria bacterium]|jgi:hypothetical protein|nr:hypothetical protein [Pseudomonadota bacterium]
MSRDVYKEICELLDTRDVVNRHSFFQMKYFIINKEPTHQSKLWRCMRELYVRRDAVDAMLMEIEECKDNLELLDIEMERLQIPDFPQENGMEELNKREKEIRLRKLERTRKAGHAQIATLEKKLMETQEEAAFFYEAFVSLEKNGKLKPYDDLASQKEFWNEKITQEFQMRALTGQPADVDLARTTMSLMDDMPVKQQFLQALNTKKKQMEIKSE